VDHFKIASKIEKTRETCHLFFDCRNNWYI